jgi:hypothetical protein
VSNEALLAFLEQRFAVNPAIRERIRALAGGVAEQDNRDDL